MVAEVQYGLVIWEHFWFLSRQQRASVKKKGTDREAKNEQKDRIENGNGICFVTVIFTPTNALSSGRTMRSRLVHKGSIWEDTIQPTPNIGLQRKAATFPVDLV